jgi:hypothetical protein
MIPAGARILRNANGTAPGLAIEVRPNPFRADGRPSWLILLPGPPRELRPMFAESVVPLLSRELPPPEKMVCLILKTTGLGESLVEEKIAGPLQSWSSRIGVGLLRAHWRSGSPSGRSWRRRRKHGPSGRGRGAPTFGPAGLCRRRRTAMEATLVRMLTEAGQDLGLAGVWTFFARHRGQSQRDWNLSAQGCEERATLGGQYRIENNPERVESKLLRRMNS